MTAPRQDPSLCRLSSLVFGQGEPRRQVTHLGWLGGRAERPSMFNSENPGTSRNSSTGALGINTFGWGRWGNPGGTTKPPRQPATYGFANRWSEKVALERAAPSYAGTYRMTHYSRTAEQRQGQQVSALLYVGSRESLNSSVCSDGREVSPNTTLWVGDVRRFFRHPSQ